MMQTVIFVGFVLLLAGCGALPRTHHDTVDAPRVTDTGMTGFVISSTDSNYTSTALYFYDLKKGEIFLLSGGESGDIMTKWLGKELYVFNRSPGRVSYSSLSPRSGISSRSVEVKTPGAEMFEPTDVAMIDQRLVLSMNTLGKIVIAKGDSVEHELRGVDTGNDAFRPASLHVRDAAVGHDIWILHQSLTADYKASGGGQIFLSHHENGQDFGWIDLDSASAGVQGLTLNVSNPIGFVNESKASALIPGACYDSMGPKCIAGLDRVDFATRNVTHVATLDHDQWSANGGMVDGPDENTVFACVTQRETSTKYLVRYDLVQNVLTPIFTYQGPGCTGVMFDQVANHLFVGDVLTDGKSTLTTIDVDGHVLSTTHLDMRVGGFTATYD